MQLTVADKPEAALQTYMSSITLKKISPCLHDRAVCGHRAADEQPKLGYGCVDLAWGDAVSVRAEEKPPIPHQPRCPPSLISRPATLHTPLTAQKRIQLTWGAHGRKGRRSRYSKFDKSFAKYGFFNWKLDLEKEPRLSEEQQS